jgi:hypothetical protein
MNALYILLLIFLALIVVVVGIATSRGRSPHPFFEDYEDFDVPYGKRRE